MEVEYDVNIPISTWEVCKRRPDMHRHKIKREVPQIPELHCEKCGLTLLSEDELKRNPELALKWLRILFCLVLHGNLDMTVCCPECDKSNDKR